jgi:hypothetical protein
MRLTDCLDLMTINFFLIFEIIAVLIYLKSLDSKKNKKILINKFN